MTENTNTPLTYQNKWDLGNKPVPPIFVKFYGVVIFILECGYLWKLHTHQKAAILQATIAALAAALAVSIVAQLLMKTAKTNVFFLVYQLIFILTMVISIFSLS